MDLPDLQLDPCGRAAALRTIRDQLITGGQEILVRTRTHDSEREVRFEKADMGRVDEALAEAQSACAKLTGVQDGRRRFAMRGGSFGPGTPLYGFGWPGYTS